MKLFAIASLIGVLNAQTHHEEQLLTPYAQQQEEWEKGKLKIREAIYENKVKQWGLEENAIKDNVLYYKEQAKVELEMRKLALLYCNKYMAPSYNENAEEDEKSAHVTQQHEKLPLEKQQNYRKKAEIIRQKLKKFGFEEEPVDLDMIVNLCLNKNKIKSEHKELLQTREIEFEDRARANGFWAKYEKQNADSFQELAKIHHEEGQLDEAEGHWQRDKLQKIFENTSEKQEKEWNLWAKQTQEKENEDRLKAEKFQEKLKKLGEEQDDPIDLMTAIDQAIQHVELMSAIDEALGHVELMSAIDEALGHVELMSAIDEAFDHVELMSSIDEAVEHIELLSAIDEAVAQVNMMEVEKESTSWGTIALSACGVVAAIGGAGYLIQKTQAFKKEQVYESLV